MSESYLKSNYFKKGYENGPFVASVKIGIKAKQKKKVKITPSYKIFVLIDDKIIYLTQKNELVYHFSF